MPGPSGRREYACSAGDKGRPSHYRSGHGHTSTCEYHAAYRGTDRHLAAEQHAEAHGDDHAHANSYAYTDRDHQFDPSPHEHVTTHGNQDPRVGHEYARATAHSHPGTAATDQHGAATCRNAATACGKL
jgi:hypothetical protein